MSLIRNGGFERGTTDFWHVETDGTLDISTSSPKYGTYCGKFISGGNTDELILSDDYVEVTPYQIVSGVLWIKSVTARDTYLMIYAYDVDYSYIETFYGNLKSMNGSYLMLNNQFTVPVNCAYIRFGCRINRSSVNEEFYLDGGMLNIITRDSVTNGVIELLPLTYYNTTGGTYSNAKDMKQFSTYYAELQCVYVDDPSSTLDVDVYEIDAFGESILLASFPQVTEASEQRIDLPHCQGNQMFLMYTIAGTTPSFEFGVAVIGKG